MISFQETQGNAQIRKVVHNEPARPSGPMPLVYGNYDVDSRMVWSKLTMAPTVCRDSQRQPADVFPRPITETHTSHRVTILPVNKESNNLLFRISNCHSSGVFRCRGYLAVLIPSSSILIISDWGRFAELVSYVTSP